MRLDDGYEYEDKSDGDVGGVEGAAADSADVEELGDGGGGGVEFYYGEGPGVEGEGYAWGGWVGECVVRWCLRGGVGVYGPAVTRRVEIRDHCVMGTTARMRVGRDIA